MKIQACTCCGQPLPETRLGARLTPLKARNFDLIRRGGDDGIDRHDVFDIVYGANDARSGINPGKFSTLKANMAQINELIEDTGYRIEGRRAARLVKKRAGDAAQSLFVKSKE